MPQTDDFCLVCGDTCTCQMKGKRRRLRVIPSAVQPLDKPQEQSAENQPERRRPRRVAGRSAIEGINLEDAGDGNGEEVSMITAIRALAHLVNPEDLEPFAEHLLPSDYLPPEDRIASWRRRTNE